MEYIDKNFNLYFKTKSDDIIEVNSELSSKLKKLDKSSLPKNTKIILGSGPFFKISFEDGSNSIISYDPIKCLITISQSKREISLYSFKHLKLILDKLKDEYKNPYFYSNNFKKNILVTDNQIEDDEYFSYESSIEIKDKKDEEDIQKIKNFFKNIKNIYTSEKGITYKFISPNFNEYFPLINKDKLTDEFNYFYSDKRKSLELEFSLFLDKDSEMIYPICGPHNIGKTITAMRIQKSNYLKGIKSLYLNLKYYFYEPFQDFDKKIDTLIKECVYFIDNEEQLLELYNKFQKLNKIKDVISILPNYLASKNFLKNKFFLIIDQYQEKYDSNNILDLFSAFKIFLLSSINDSDVKDNLILTQQEKSLKKYKLIKQKQDKKIIRFTYYEYLLPKIQKYIKQDIQIEKRKSKKNIDSKEELIFLNKKHKRNYNKDKIYNSLKDYILTKKFGFSIGKFIHIESFIDKEIKINKNQYIIIFSLNEEDDSTINFKKPIGFIFSEKEKEKQVYLDATKNITYTNYEELFDLFSSQSYYGIGEIEEL